jgi:uncharacterized protein YlxW (UPF0749 family)
MSRDEEAEKVRRELRDLIEKYRKLLKEIEDFERKIKGSRK